MNKSTSNAILIGVGISAIAAFFLPFLDLGGLISASGWEILVSDGTPWLTRGALLALPLAGLGLIAAGATGSPKARFAGLGFGLAVYGYVGYQMVRFFFATTGVGLWLTLAAALLALVAALGTKRG